MARRTGASRGTAGRFDARANAVERHAGVIREAMAKLGATNAAAADDETAA
jgi:hypothetical protein